MRLENLGEVGFYGLLTKQGNSNLHPEIAYTRRLAN
jgi:hypothetical protein